MSAIAFAGALELGFLYGIVAVGVYLSFRIFNFPDLTVDGSFPLGAAVAGVLLASEWGGEIGAWLSLLLALGAGFLAGLMTAWLNQRFGILHLLASILTMMGLYSINLRIMGKPNIALLSKDTIVETFPDISPLYKGSVIMLFFALVVFGAIAYFLSTKQGLGFRATGANPRMALSMGVSVRRCTYLGLGLSNGLVALAGALFVHLNRFADITLGFGVIILGLAAVISGESILRPKNIVIAVLACFTGAILYRLVIAWALNADFLRFRASDLNLLTALLVAFALIAPRLKLSRDNNMILQARSLLARGWALPKGLSRSSSNKNSNKVSSKASSKASSKVRR